ncbi:hypothetical protein HanHA300_Chr17g0669471 [Helianthus annuus]|nr:hypothetical protein HanHA300_Chr17g0669471 [Helianthus annuus]KAJ0448893.1 hypothetical protein HanHA89_Chr17g0722241 [Helianthus annuus]KAJ0633767.1 hypothetical protein HanLR1_Chr17g0680601 [Helianthus annuus]
MSQMPMPQPSFTTCSSMSQHHSTLLSHLVHVRQSLVLSATPNDYPVLISYKIQKVGCISTVQLSSFVTWLIDNSLCDNEGT